MLYHFLNFKLSVISKLLKIGKQIKFLRGRQLVWSRLRGSRGALSLGALIKDERKVPRHLGSNPSDPI